MNDELPLEGESRLVAAQPTPMDLMREVIRGGINADSVGVMERLVALDREVRKDRAEMDFAGAFKALQSELGTFRATTIVPDKHGNTRYTYLRYDEIMAVVQPLAEKHGLSISFSTDFQESRIIQTCTFQHVTGHSKDFKAFVRAGAGPYGATETQADGAAMTYAKRYALCNALNIVVERDTDGQDARNEGTPISFEQAETLRELVKETGADEARFLAFAGAKTYADIGSARYDACFAALQKKRRLSPDDT